MSCPDVAPAPQLPLTAVQPGLSVLILSLLLGWRTVQGAAMGAAVMGARAMVRDLYPPAQGARIMSKGMTGVACSRFWPHRPSFLSTCWLLAKRSMDC